jgi:hypothetical protein
LPRANAFLAELVHAQPLRVPLAMPKLGPFTLPVRELTAVARDVELRPAPADRLRFAIRVAIEDAEQRITTLAIETEVKPRLVRTADASELVAGFGGESLLAVRPELSEESGHALIARPRQLAEYLTGDAYLLLQRTLLTRLGEVTRLRFRLPALPIASVALPPTTDNLADDRRHPSSPSGSSSSSRARSTARAAPPHTPGSSSETARLPPASCTRRSPMMSWSSRYSSRPSQPHHRLGEIGCDSATPSSRVCHAATGGRLYEEHSDCPREDDMSHARVSVVAALVLAPVAGCQVADGDLASSSADLSAPAIDLVAIGKISGTRADRSRATADPLENGVAGNLLGGLGSGLDYAGFGIFLAVPDRGPNAVAYNPATDDTSSYITRVQTLFMHLERSAPGSALPFALAPLLLDTTLLHSDRPLHYGSGSDVGLGAGAPALNHARHTHYFSGRSDNFDAATRSTDPDNARLDPESVRVSRDGRHVFISDEYGPHVYEFDRFTGRRVRSFALPAVLAVPTQNPRGDVEIAGNTVGRVANKGMEGLAITPDGRTLVGAMQSPLLQDGGTAAQFTRIVTIDVRTGQMRQYAYGLTNIGTAKKPKYPTVSEILAINDHEFLVDERDGKGLGDDSAAAFKNIFHIDLAGARDVTGIAGEANLASAAVAKTLFLDVVAVLTSHGIAATEIPAKLEGITFGPDVVVAGQRQHTLWVSNDNDFLGTVTDSNHPAGIDNPNQFFVFAVDPALLPGLARHRHRDHGGDRDDDCDD